MKSILTHNKKRSKPLSIVGMKGHLVPNKQMPNSKHLSRESSNVYFLSFQESKPPIQRTNTTNKRIRPYINTNNYIKKIAFQLRKVPNIHIVKKLTNKTNRSNSFRTKRNSLPKAINDPYSSIHRLCIGRHHS